MNKLMELTAIFDLGNQMIRLSELPEYGFEFISDSQDVEELKYRLLQIPEFKNDPISLVGFKASDSFFVEEKDDVIISVYGIEGIIPWLWKLAELIYARSD